MPQESTPRRERKRTVQQMVVVGVIATAAGIALGLIIPWFPPADSTQADKIDTLWDVLIIATVPIFVLVTVVVCFAVLEFRMRPGEEQLDGPPIHGNTRLEVIWTAVPAILIVGLVTYAYVVLHDIEKAPAAGNERVETVPDLDKVLKGKDAAFIKESILDPNKVIAPGYQPNIMPPNFGDTLSAQQVDALVKYLSDVTNK